MNKMLENKRWVTYAVIVLCLVIIAVMAYLQPYHTGSDVYTLYDYTEKTGTQLINISINDYNILVDCFINGAVYETGWLTTEKPTVITVGDFSDCNLYINGVEIFPNSSMEIVLTTLKKDEYINFTYYEQLHGTQTTFSIRTLPFDMPDISSESRTGDLANEYCFAMTSHNCLVKIDSSCNILYYRMSYGARDFRQHINSKGKKRYTFMEATENSLFGFEQYPYCKGVVMDENYNVIDIVETTVPQDTNTTGSALTEYGFLYLDDYDYCIVTLRSEYYQEGITNENGIICYRIINNIIQRINNGKLLWSKSLPIYSNFTDFEDNAEYIDINHLCDMKTCGSTDSIICLLKKSKKIIEINVNSGEITRCIDSPGKAEPICLTCDDKIEGFFIGENNCAVYSYDNENWQEKNTIGTDIMRFGSIDAKNDNYLIAYGLSSNQQILLSEFNSAGVPVFEVICNRINEDFDVYIDRVYYAEVNRL